MSRLANRVKTVKVSAGAGFLKLASAPGSKYRVRVLAYDLTGAGTAIFQSADADDSNKTALTGALQLPRALAGGTLDCPLMAAPENKELGVTLSAQTEGYVTIFTSEVS